MAPENKCSHKHGDGAGVGDLDRSQYYGRCVARVVAPGTKVRTPSTREKNTTMNDIGNTTKIPAKVGYIELKTP